jgi:hypothetical protein
MPGPLGATLHRAVATEESVRAGRTWTQQTDSEPETTVAWEG